MGTKPRKQWFDLPSDWWGRFDDLVTDVWKITLEAFFDEKTEISEKHLRRSKESRKISKDSLRKLASAFGYGNDWRTMLEKLGGKPPPMATSAGSHFQDINPQIGQPILPAERPHPHPSEANNSPLPFQRNLDGDIYFVAGWNLRFKANVHYRVSCDFVRKEAWPEIEIVLFERVLHTEKWKRSASFGAVTSGRPVSDITPEVEEWLITAWGKNVIADNAPWYDFIPVLDFELDATAGLLKLPFTAANRKGDGLPLAEPSLTVHIRAVE